MELAEEVPDLTGNVDILSYRPVFKGPYSTVYRGRLKDCGEIVAVKVLNVIQDTALHTIRRKIERERRTWSLLRHQNILPFYGFADGDEHFQPFGAFISPWCQHGDMAQYIQEKAPSAPLNERLDLWKGVVAGVLYLHTHDPILVHGDLKPRNILIDDHGRAQLCDFGLVRVLLEAGNSGMTTTTAHTGTLRYLAHELVTAEEPVPTTASDIYATGCIGLEVIFLTIPYSNHANGHNLLWHIRIDMQAGTPPASRPAELPALLSELWEAISLCWASEPCSRPRAYDLQMRLEEVDRPIDAEGRQSANTVLVVKAEAKSSITGTFEPPPQKRPSMPSLPPPERLKPASTSLNSSSRMQVASPESRVTRYSQERSPTHLTRDRWGPPPAHYHTQTENSYAFGNDKEVPVYAVGSFSRSVVAGPAASYTPRSKPPKATAREPTTPTATTSAAPPEPEIRPWNLQPGDGYLHPVQIFANWFFGDDREQLNSNSHGYIPSSAFTYAVPTPTRPSLPTTFYSSKATSQFSWWGTKSWRDGSPIEILALFSHQYPAYEIKYSCYTVDVSDHPKWVGTYSMGRRVIAVGDSATSIAESQLSAARRALNTLHEWGYRINTPTKTSSSS